MGKLINMNDYRMAKKKLPQGITGIEQSRLDEISCMHDACPRCHGSGKRLDNQEVCIHFVSCRCKKCSLR